MTLIKNLGEAFDSLSVLKIQLNSSENDHADAKHDVYDALYTKLEPYLNGNQFYYKVLQGCSLLWKK
jgi:hypothetical protein